MEYLFKTTKSIKIKQFRKPKYFKQQNTKDFIVIIK